MFDPKAHLIQLPRRVKDQATGQYVTVYDDYLEVKWRVVLFREQYPHGRITTDEIVVDLDRGYARYKATVEDGQGGQVTGYGTETQADFADFCERAETRALGRALAGLGYGTQFVGQDLTEGDHVADAPVVTTHGQPSTLARDGGQGDPSAPDQQGPVPPEARLTQDQARDLKRLAQSAFGYEAGERRLRADLGFEPDERLSLRHLAAHVSVGRWQALTDAYEAHLKAAVEADVPDHAPPAANWPPAGTTLNGAEPSSTVAGVPINGTPVPEPPEAEARQRWGALSRRSLRAGVSPTVWEALRQGTYGAAERMIAALEGPEGAADGD